MRGIPHAIFWKLHTAYLRNERDEALLFLGMLEDEERRGADIMGEIGQIHYDRLQIIRENVGNGKFGRLYGYGTAIPTVDFFPASERTIEEAEFHRKLMSKEGKARLYDCLGIEFWADLVHEVDMKDYGRVDFLIREGRTWHIIEVKINRAESSVVSQVDKYVVSAELDMCLGMHDKVFGTVIAGGFPPYVASELSRTNIMMVTHVGADTATLRRISNAQIH